MQDLAEHVVRMCTESTETSIVLESAVIPQEQLASLTPYTDANKFARHWHRYFAPDEYTDEDLDGDEMDLRTFRQFRVRCTVPVRTYALETGTITLNCRYYDDMEAIQEWTLVRTFRSATSAIDLLFRLATTRTKVDTNVFLRVGDDRWVSFTHDDRIAIVEIMKDLGPSV